MTEKSHTREIQITKGLVGYWWNIVGNLAMSAQGWRYTKQGAIKAGRKYKARQQKWRNIEANSEFFE